jgi:hypothetical protein
MQADGEKKLFAQRKINSVSLRGSKTMALQLVTGTHQGEMQSLKPLPRR